MQAIRAINRQINRISSPIGHSGEPSTGGAKREEAASATPRGFTGDAVIYLWNEVDEAKEALGYHDRNNLGIPYGFVFTEISKELGEAWTVTLSHEALELVGDAQAISSSQGPTKEFPKNRLSLVRNVRCRAGGNHLD